MNKAKLNRYAQELSDLALENGKIGASIIIAESELKKSRKEEGMIKKKMRTRMRYIMQNCGLTPREQKIIEIRFGLEDGKTRTLEEVGQEFGVTRDRIRQIEDKALSKMMSSLNNK